MNENSGGTHEPKPNRGRSNEPSGRYPSCDACKNSDDESFRKCVKHRVIAKKGIEAKLPTVTKDHSYERDQHSVKPGKPQQEPMPAFPDVRRQGSPARKERPDVFQKRR